MNSIIDEKEKKKREKEFDQMFSNSSISKQANANIFDNSSISNNDEYTKRANEFDLMFGNLVDMKYVQDKKFEEQQKKMEDQLQQAKTQNTQKLTVQENSQETTVNNNVKNILNSNNNSKERWNVIARGNKLSSLKTAEEIQQENAQKEFASRTNSDKNILSQLGKFFENLWLGGVNGLMQATKVATDVDYENKSQESTLLAGNNSNIPEVVTQEYKSQNNNSILDNKAKQQKVNEKFSLIRFTPEYQQINNTNSKIISDETKRKIDNDIKGYTNQYGEIELNPLQLKLEKSLNKNNQKIEDNVNEISNPAIKKMAEIAPSTSNSLVGAGLSTVNPMLGLSYFTASAMGNYEDSGRQMGMSKDEAKAYSRIMGIMESATEMVGIDKFIKGVKVGNISKLAKIKQTLKYYGMNVADNAIQEAIIDPIDEAVAFLASGKTKNDYSTPKGTSQLISDMIKDGIDGALSAMLMDAVGLGINSSVRVYNKITNNQLPTQQEFTRAFQDINNDERIQIEDYFAKNFDHEKNRILDGNAGEYYSIDFDNDGNIIDMTKGQGTTIDYKGDANIAPVIMLINNNYNVIDANTGLKLDTTPYQTIQEAKTGFTEKIENSNSSAIQEINNRVNKAKLSIINTINQADVDITTGISNKQMYNREATIQLLNENGIDTSNIQKRSYLGKEINDIIRNPDSYVPTSTKNVFRNDTANNTQTSSEPNASNFYDTTTNYAVQDIKKVTEPFNKQNEYTVEEMAEVWNNDISGKDYDISYDNNGNIKSYIAIEEEGNNIVVNQYDNNDNIVKSEVIPNENGRYKASDIQDTIDKVASLYDENRPIKGQRDIEGNEVKSMKKKTSNKKSNNIQEDIENFSKQVDAVVDGTFPKRSMLTILSETPKPLQDIGLPNLPITMTQRHLDTILNETGNDKNANYHNLGITTIKELPEAISNPLDIVMSNTRGDSIVLTTYLADKENRTVVASIKIDGKGLVNKILIDTNVMTSAYGRNNYEAWMDKNLKEGKLLYDIDRGVIKKVDVARLQLPGSTNSTTKTNGSNSNNIIPLTNKIVKNDKNVTTKQSMQNNKNNTLLQGQQDIEGDEVKSLKNNNETSQKIKKELHSKIQNAINNKTSRKKTNLGIISTKTANKIEKIIGIDVTQRKHILLDNDIRHMINQHGDKIKETKKGQIAITLKDIERIPDIINNYDRLVEGTTNTKGEQTIRYIKRFGEKRNYVVEIVPNNQKDLIIKTMWIKPIRVINSQQTPNLTSKAKPNNGISTSINNSITQKRKPVKNNTAINNQSTQNKRNNAQESIKSLKDIKTKYKNQTEQLNIFENKDNTISINNLVVKQDLRNQGIGQSILNDIINYADKNNKTITLTPTSKYLTKNKLTTWYKNNGFVENKGRNTDFSISDTMYRLPKNNQNVKDDGVRAMKKSTSKSNTTQANTVVDNQGRTLSKQQQEYFKNSKVRDYDGNLLTVYHGTDKAFTEFKNKYIQHGRAIIDGFYLTPDRTNANKYGNNIMELYVNIQNPLYLHNYNGITRELIERGYANNTDELISKYNLETDDSGVVPTAKALTKLVKKLGYDGIITTTNNNDVIDTDWSATQIVALNSNQIKNIDNTNPTSDKDIRFAKKTSKPVNDVLEPGQTNAQRSSNYIEQEIQKIEQTGNWNDSIPVTKMTDIRKTIENYLGLGIQKGYFRQQAYGIYKSNRDVIRTKELKDIDTILHETGHALDLGNRIKLNKENISNELLKAVKNYGGYETETREVQLEEGFAEVIREYTIVPEQAKVDYPQTVAVLEGIRQENKDFDNFIKTVQEQTYNYIHQNPRNRGGLSNQSIGERTDKMPLTPESIKQTIIENAWDSNYSIKRAVQVLQEKSGNKELRASENAYLLARLTSGIGDKVTSILSNGYIDENGNKMFPGLSQLGEILGNDVERFNDLRAYLVAQRDLEYKAKGLKTGIRTNDAKAIIEQFKNDTQIQEASKVIYDTLDGVLQYAVNNKLITPDNAQTLRESNVFYVPMQRVIGTNGNNVGRKGAVADIIKTRTGSELDIKDVLENIVTNSANILQQVENNKVLNSLYTQGENAGLTGSVYDEIDPPMKKVGIARLDMWENELKKQGIDIEKIDFDKTIDIFVPNNNIDERQQIVSFIDNRGQRRYLQFKDEILFKAMTGLDRESTSRVLNFCNTLNKPLRYGATLANLGFALPNMLADTVQASIYSEAGFIPLIDTAIGALDVLTAQNKTVRNFMNKVAPEYAERINTMYELYLQSGATSATKIGQERKSAQRLMKDIYGTKDSETLGINDKFVPLKRLLDIMTYIPELSEQSSRFRVFEKNLDYYRRNGMAEIDARMEAAIQSRDATQDFSRMGKTMREVNKVIPFSAARVGSAYTFAEKMKANPKRTSARIAIMLVLNMALKELTSDDDEINELNQRKKDDNFVFKIGEQVITIKKPQGFLRSLINLNDYIIDLANGNIEEGKEGKRLKEWLFNAIMDNSVADDITGFVPSAITPLLENAINKDLYYNSDIVKSYDLELPDSEQYYDYNSQLAIWLGKIFNYSPAKIDNFISGYFAGLGTQVTNIIDWAVSAMGITPKEADMGLEGNSIGKRFFVNVNSNSASIDEIYNLKTDLTKKKNGGTITSEETEQLETITNAISEISKLNKQIKEIKADTEMSGKEKAEQIKLLQQQKTDTARQALGKDLIYAENQSKIESTKLYPSRDTLTQNGRTLTMNAEMKKEYEQVANEYYNKYAKQGLYSKEKLEQIKDKSKNYAKKYMLKKYKNQLEE